jgi:thiamine-monophosphate kinase
MSHALGAIFEVAAIDRLVGAFKRHPSQANAPHEADAELIALGPSCWLAVTLDALTSEISSGIFQDPYTMGWVLATASLSDLAAVGARPIGLLDALNFARAHDTAWRARLVKGLKEALDAMGVYLLGGDLNECQQETSLTGCAIGWVEGAPPLTRRGLQPDDWLYASGPLGMGNALALAFLGGKEEMAREIEAAYRPQARLAEGQFLRDWACVCMDTSDGPMTTLDHLARLNGVGLDVFFEPKRLIASQAQIWATQLASPLWPLLLGEHGEYELVFGIHDAKRQAFEAAATSKGFSPLLLGRATDAAGLRLVLEGAQAIPFDGGYVRNLLAEVQGDWSRFVPAFWAFGARLGLKE